MKKMILLILLSILFCSFAYAGNLTGTGYQWYQDHSDFNGWTFVTNFGDESGSPKFITTTFDGFDVWKDTTAGASHIQLNMAVLNKPLCYAMDVYATTDEWAGIRPYDDGVSKGYNWIRSFNLAGDDVVLSSNVGGVVTVSTDVDPPTATWNDLKILINNTYMKIYVNDSYVATSNYNTPPLAISDIDEFTLRTEGQNTYFKDIRFWYGGCLDEPSSISSPVFSTSLDYPTNETTSFSYSGYINISLLNVNGSANCTLNNSDWSFFSNDNLTYSFYRNNTSAHQNYSIDYNCFDTGGAWSNSSFWFNLENRLIINLYDEQTNKKINDSISFIFRSNNYEYKDTSTNGTYILYNDSGLPPDTYQVTLNGSQYYQRIYYLTVTADQVQNKNFYLLKTNQSSLVTFFIKDLSDQFIENVSVIFTTWINLTDSDAPITHRYTDYAGSILVNLHPLTRYGISISDPNKIYSPKYKEIEPVFATYTIYLNKNISQNFTTVWDHVSYEIGIQNMTLNPSLTNFSITTLSDNGNIENYGLYATIGATTYKNNITTHASGGTASISLPLNESNNQNVYVTYFIKTTNPDNLFLPITYSVLNISSWVGNNSISMIAPEYRSEFSERIRLLSAHFIAILVIGIFSGFIKKNYAPLLGIPVLILFAVPPISWIPIWITAFESIIIIGFFIAFGDW